MMKLYTVVMVFREIMANFDISGS